MFELKKKFLEERLNKDIRIIFNNGFQLRGLLLGYDEESVSVIAPVYHSDKPSIISQASISAYTHA